MLRACTFEKLEAVESPATGDTCWLCDAAAATGTENRDRDRGEVALRKSDANTLATFTKTRGSRARSGCANVGRVRDDGGMGCQSWTTRVRVCSGVPSVLYENKKMREKGLEG